MAFSFLRLGAPVSRRAFQKGLQPTRVVCFEQMSCRPTQGAFIQEKLWQNPIGLMSCRPTQGAFIQEKLWQNPIGLESRLYSKYVVGKQEKEQLSTQSDSDSDSDDESEGRVRGESEFWRRKMRTFHGILDINKDGVISFEDLQILVDRFVDLGHLSLQHQKEFNNVIKTMWEKRWGSIDRYNMITTEQYLEDMHHVLNDKNLRKKVHNFLPYLFKALDKDKSGLISVEEYKLFFKCLGLTDEAAIVSFSVIDENSDGQLSMKEFIKLGREFFVNEDQKRPSKMFWGPLVL